VQYLGYDEAWWRNDTLSAGGFCPCHARENKAWFAPAASASPAGAYFGGRTAATGLPEDLWAAYWESERDYAQGTNVTGAPADPASFYRMQPAFRVPKGSEAGAHAMQINDFVCVLVCWCVYLGVNGVIGGRKQIFVATSGAPLEDAAAALKTHPHLLNKPSPRAADATSTYSVLREFWRRNFGDRRKPWSHLHRCVS
jgi:hypothetical protein